ncbi:MAG: hypothetical protein FWF51_08670, partial [Chitinivibrionia bacterium]|nr:hypothetical protein [Chitinivibrionia bacterium]
LGEGKSTAWMKSAAIITELNEVATLLELRLWELSSQNNGYPVLSQTSGSINIASYFDGGIGSNTNPYQIRTPQQLENLSTLVDAGYDFDGIYFLLTANIELNNTDNWENWTATNAPAKIWKPIGYYAGGGVDFKGIFDGNGKTVSGVYINSGGYMGFFGSTGTNAEIKNLGIIKSYIHATEIYAGGLVAMNAGKISNCYFNGKVVSAYRPQYAPYVAYTGGLVGQNSGSFAVISNSYAIGSLDGGTVGGLGGLVGVNRGHVNAKIEKSYSAVKITTSSNERVGGLVGYLEVGTVVESYYDATLNANIADTKNEGKSTIAFKKIATFTNWDFANIWGRNNSTNGGYPHLRWGSTVANDADSEEEEPTNPSNPNNPNEPNNNTNISDVKKSGNNFGIIFEKNVVSDELKIIEVVISRDGDKKVSAQASKTIIYDNTGNIVFSGEGKNAIAWNLRNKQGRFVANGTYLVIVEAKNGDKSYWYSAKIGVKR